MTLAAEGASWIPAYWLSESQRGIPTFITYLAAGDPGFFSLSCVRTTVCWAFQNTCLVVPGEKTQEAARAGYSAQVTKMQAKIMSDRCHTSDDIGRAVVPTPWFLPGFGRRAAKSLTRLVWLGLNPVVICLPCFTKTSFPKLSFPSIRMINQPNYLHLAFGSRKLFRLREKGNLSLSSSKAIKQSYF